jgi:hypothetical protein
MSARIRRSSPDQQNIFESKWTPPPLLFPSVEDRGVIPEVQQLSLRTESKKREGPEHH